MPKPYSDDLRLRVVAAVGEGASRHEAADRFDVSPSSAIRWVEKFEQSGSVSAKLGLPRFRGEVRSWDQGI
jgi:transposase